jgi:hypothetical protein
MSSTASSRYFHSALQMGSKNADILYKYGFTAQEMPALLAEPAAQQAAQEAVMQQMASMFSGPGMGGFAELLSSLTGGDEAVDPNDAMQGFQAGMQEAFQQLNSGQFPDLAALTGPGGVPAPGGFGGFGGLPDGGMMGLPDGGLGNPAFGFDGMGNSRVEGLDDDGAAPGDLPPGSFPPPSGCNPQ